MGLDWCLHRTDDPEKSPLELLGDVRCDTSNPVHVAACMEIIQSHRDNIAENPNVREEYRKHWLQPDIVLLNGMEGKILMPLVERAIKDLTVALPARGNPFSVMTGLESFRGKRVQYCKSLPERLTNRAFNELTAEQMSEYADQLEACAPDVDEAFLTTRATYKKWHETAHILEDYPESVPDDFWDRLTIYDAVAWLRFWSQYPVKMVPWY